MQPTYILMIQLVVGLLILLRGTLASAFVFMMACGVLGGSAALLLPALGGSSIPPLQVGLVLVIIAAAMSPSRPLLLLPEAIRANRWLVIFVLYGIATAILAPRLFAGTMQVAPLKPLEYGGLFETALLAPSSQNLTSAFYLFGTLLVALAAYLVTVTQRGGIAALISAGIAIAWTHVALGLIVMTARGTPLDPLLDLIRNGNYAQLDQGYQGFVRIRGLFPEPSAYAEFGFAIMVMNAELWYRGIRPGATGPAAFALALMLTFSTSSTAYVALGAYLLFFVLRVFFMPRLAPASRVRQFGSALVVILVLVASTMLVVPQLPIKFADMINAMTVGKSDSLSGQQRLFWALQGWSTFINSYGLGVGPGSFRSSSLLTAILGSTGIIGTVSFIIYLFAVLQPLRQSTYGQANALEHSIGGAFAVAALFSLIPAFASSPKADPGTNFALLAGAALALRPQTSRKLSRPRTHSADAARSEIRLSSPA